MKYEAIDEYRHQFSVRKMCKALEIRESNYYRWRKRQEKKEKDNWKERLLIYKVEKIFKENHKVYGYRKMQKALLETGVKITEYRIRKIMRENGFYPETNIKYKPYRNGKVAGIYKPNLVEQEFKTEEPCKVWVGDITYIKTSIGWVYLAAIMDLYNREVVGYAISKQIDTELVKKALGNAIREKDKVKGLIFHSDRGCQYTSKGYQQMLEEYNIVSSMSRPGCPYDNSCMESFFASLKKECIHRKQYDTMEEVKRDIFAYVELFYNRKRLHAYLGYMSPVAYRIKMNQEKSA